MINCGTKTQISYIHNQCECKYETVKKLGMFLARYMCSNCLNATLSNQLRLNSLKYTSWCVLTGLKGLIFLILIRMMNVKNWTHALFWHYITNLTGALSKGIAVLIVIHKTCPPIILL